MTAHRLALTAGTLAIFVMAGASVFVGVTDISPLDLLAGRADARDGLILAASRIPRTLALVLAGASLAICGSLLQMMVRNRFVEPSTVGTVEAASLGILVTLIFWPGAPVIVKMMVAALFALAGTALFLRILSMVKLRDVLIVPLIGLMLTGVIEAVTDFFAYRFELLQALASWRAGDFSGVLRGRYELLWIAGFATAAVWFVADRFTLIGLGRDLATNLGVAYRAMMAMGLVVIAIASAVVTVTVGLVPFLGLIVPNIVALILGDNLRRSLPFVALTGAGLVLVCDIGARLIRFPYEIPVGTVMGVTGAAIFLFILLRRPAHG